MLSNVILWVLRQTLIYKKNIGYLLILLYQKGDYFIVGLTLPKFERSEFIQESHICTIRTKFSDL